MSTALAQRTRVATSTSPPDDVFSTLINVAGRQRMLSQRIALFALLALRGDGHALPTAQDALLLFRDSHAALTRGRGGLPTPFNAELKLAFFGPQGADGPISDFIRIAEDTLADIAQHAPTAERRVLTLVARATPMLELLNCLTQTYEAQAQGHARAQLERQAALIGRIQAIAGEARIASRNASLIAARAGDSGDEFALVAGALSDITEQIETLAAGG